MTPRDRSTIALAYKELFEAAAAFSDTAMTSERATALLLDARRLQEAADELFDRVRLLSLPTVLAFGGGDVRLDDLPARTAEEDRAANRAMAEQHRFDADRLEKARAEAGIKSLLDDTASATNSDRDHRGAA